MQLADLRPNEGARKRKKRVGRGRASGHGKTSTRGHNGQGQRSGESRRFGFEGGQTPLFRRLPKIHNFDQVVTREWVEVNVGALNNLAANTEVDAESLVKHKVLRKHTDSLRILGNGELKVALKVKAHHVSEGARQKIEAAGGSVELIEANVVEGKRQRRFDRAVIAYENKKNAPKANIAEREERAQKRLEAKENKAKAPAKPAKGGGGGGAPAGKQGAAKKPGGDAKGGGKKK
ncbi:MAG TPA: 50S ribosomal protein L15 [Oculatellaceae cyanobacterium]